MYSIKGAKDGSELMFGCRSVGGSSFKRECLGLENDFFDWVRDACSAKGYCKFDSSWLCIFVRTKSVDRDNSFLIKGVVNLRTNFLSRVDKFIV